MVVELSSNFYGALPRPSLQITTFEGQNQADLLQGLNYKPLQTCPTRQWWILTDTLYLRKVEILRRSWPDFDPRARKIVPAEDTLQHFVLGEKPLKLQGEPHVQDFVPLRDYLCSIFAQHLPNIWTTGGPLPHDLRLQMSGSQPPGSQVLTVDLGCPFLAQHVQRLYTLGPQIRVFLETWSIKKAGSFRDWANDGEGQTRYHL